MKCLVDDDPVVGVEKQVQGQEKATKKNKSSSSLQVFRVFNRRQYADMNDELKRLIQIAHDLRNRFDLYQQPGVLPPPKIEENDKAIFMLRQYFAWNLYDRLFGQPSLTDIEKAWLTYQLLRALDQMHSAGVTHGDIKSENILLTTWNWLFLSDIAFYKPTFLPADNPAKFNFFFENKKRRTCYLAPERFYIDFKSSEDARVAEEMDMFSAGCVIAEIYLDGKHQLFDLSQLLAYREGKYDLSPIINKIPNQEVRQLVRHMTQLEPKDRWLADQYIKEFSNTIFPGYFQYLYNWFQGVIQTEFPRPKDKINRLHKDRAAILRELVGRDAEEEMVRRRAGKGAEGQPNLKAHSLTKHFVATEGSEEAAHKGSLDLLRNAEEFQQSVTASVTASGDDPTLTSPPSTNVSRIGGPPLPRLAHSMNDDTSQTFDGQGLTMIICLICSCIQNVSVPSAKLRALDLFLEFGRYVGDNVRLGRIVPYVVQMLSSSEAGVKAAALETLTSTLELVTSFAQSDSDIFPAYILPALRRFPQDDSELVRLSYAQCIARLAETARRFLEIAQVNENDQASHGKMASYDVELHNLQQALLKEVIDILTGQRNHQVKRCLLVDITRLCIFLGKSKVNDDLLPHLISVLNDRDWELRAAFFENIVGVSVFVGKVAFQNCVLPCIETALTDPQRAVTQRAVHALTALTELGMCDPATLKPILPKLAPLLCHPSPWIRNEVVDFVCCLDSVFGPAKSFCFLQPVLAPFLLDDQAFLFGDRESFLLSLKRPLTQDEFVLASGNTEYAREYIRKASRPTGSMPAGGASGTQGAASAGGMPRNDTSQSLLLKKDEGYDSELDKPEETVLKERDDPVLMAQMTEYIVRVSASVQYSEGINVEEDAELQQYSNLESVVEVRAVEIQPSISHPKDNEEAASLEQVTQELYASLGVSLAYDSKDPSIASAETPTTRGRMASRVNAAVKDDKNKMTTKKAQKPNNVNRKILRALKVPPGPLDLGRLRYDTMSTSSVFNGAKGFCDAHPMDWEPKGELVCTLSDHKAAVNKLAIARDNVFIASCSDDGTVKIWRAYESEDENLVVSPRTAERTYTQGGKLVSMVICDGSHSIACASTNGTVHVFKVEHGGNTGGGKAPWGLVNVKKVEAKEGAIRQVEHAHTISESLLIYGTSRGCIHGWDLRAKAEAFKWKLNEAHGGLTVMAMTPTPVSLAFGTTRGFVSLWDIRYQLAVQQWRHSSKSKVVYLESFHSQQSQPVLPAFSETPESKGPTILMSTEGTNQLNLFDLYTGEIKGVLRILQTSQIVNTNSPKTTTKLPDYIEKYNRSKNTTSTKQASNSKTMQPNPRASVPTTKTPTSSATPRTEKKGIVGLDLPYLWPLTKRSESSLIDENFVSDLQGMLDEKSGDSLTSAIVCPGSYVVSGGTDSVVRFWNMRKIEHSYRISAPPTVPPPVKMSSRIENHATVFEELVTAPEYDKQSMMTKRRGLVPLPTSHADYILDIKALEFPNKMLATASRDGTVKVWV